MSPGNPIGHKRNPGPRELLSADFGGRRDSSLRFSPGYLKIAMPDFQAATSIDLCLTYFRFFTFFIWQLCKTFCFCHLLMLINASCVTDGLIDWGGGGWMGVAQKCVAFSFVKDAIYLHIWLLGSIDLSHFRNAIFLEVLLGNFTRKCFLRQSLIIMEI